MSKASGFVLIVTGLAVTAYVLPSTLTDDAIEPDFSQGTKISNTRLETANMSAAAPTSSVTKQEAVAAKPLAAVQSASWQTVEPSPSLSAPIVVILPQRPVEQPAPEARYSIPKDRDAIGRQLQKELKRVGCYEGELNGVWTRSTCQSMKTFTDRVNATLPTDEPDSILLTLVQAYHNQVCGKPCPAGQGLSNTGRCLPNAILARTSGAKGASIAAATPAERPTPAIIVWTATAGVTPNPPRDAAPTEGRMSLAGPTTPTRLVQMPKLAPPDAADRRRLVDVERQGSWARNLFKQWDRLSAN